MEAVISPLRQDILDAFTAIGPCSVKQIARQLGKPADSIYYHMRRLLEVGLLKVIGTRETTRRDEFIYDVPAEKLELCYDLGDPDNVDVVLRITSSMLRRAQKNFEQAVELESVKPTGPERNFRVMGGMLWLSKEDLREVNRHLNAILDLYGRPPAGKAHQLCAITSIISPVEPRPVRRGKAQASSK